MHHSGNLYHDCLAGTHAELFTNEQSVVRIRLGDGVLVISTEHKVHHSLKAELGEELLGSLPGVGGADCNLNVWRREIVMSIS